MKKNKSNVIKQGSGIPIGIGIGIGISLTVTMICLALFALLLTNGSISQNQIRLLSCVALIIGAAIGSAIAIRIANQKPLICGLVNAGTFYLVLLAVTALFFEGRYQGMGVNAICVLTGAGIGILPKVMPKKSRTARFKKTYYR